jgi:hypothetical protein
MADKYQVYARQELATIDASLKDWFLSRRVAMERNMGIKAQLDSANMTGLCMNNSTVPTEQMSMWNDLVRGTPALEAELSMNAKEMKADMYAKLFDESTDMNHDCKVPGSVFLRCLKSSVSEPSKQCGASFNVFDACRKSMVQQQAAATSKSMMAQDLADKRAKALFDRRSVLLQAITGQPASVL